MKRKYLKEIYENLKALKKMLDGNELSITIDNLDFTEEFENEFEEKFEDTFKQYRRTNIYIRKDIDEVEELYEIYEIFSNLHFNLNEDLLSQVKNIKNHVWYCQLNVVNNNIMYEMEKITDYIEKIIYIEELQK